MLFDTQNLLHRGAVHPIMSTADSEERQHCRKLWTGIGGGHNKSVACRPVKLDHRHPVECAILCHRRSYCGNCSGLRTLHVELSIDRAAEAGLSIVTLSFQYVLSYRYICVWHLEGRYAGEVA